MEQIIKNTCLKVLANSRYIEDFLTMSETAEIQRLGEVSPALAHSERGDWGVLLTASQGWGVRYWSPESKGCVRNQENGWTALGLGGTSKNCNLEK